MARATTSDSLVRLKSCDIHGGSVIVFGDLHISCTFAGQHKSYTAECYYNMERITDIVAKEQPSAVIFLGDLFGVSEKNIRDRQFLMRVMMFLGALNHLTNNNVYSVKGNHDCGDFTDFDFLCGMQYIKNPEYLNYYGKIPGSSKIGNLQLRLHLVNYGDEHKKLELTSPDDEASDIVLGHNEYSIEGVTNWYSSKSQRVELKTLNNFCGVAYVISGHIHQPSPEIYYTNMKDGSQIGLFYAGAPGRVIERYDNCWYFKFYCEQDKTASDGVSVRFAAEPFGLQPASEVFYPKDSFVDEEGSEQSERLEQSAKLTEIVKEILEGRITTGNLFSQIDKVPGVSVEAKNLAKRYLELATNGTK